MRGRWESDAGWCRRLGSPSGHRAFGAHRSVSPWCRRGLGTAVPEGGRVTDTVNAPRRVRLTEAAEGWRCSGELSRLILNGLSLLGKCSIKPAPFTSTRAWLLSLCVLCRIAVHPSLLPSADQLTDRVGESLRRVGSRPPPGTQPQERSLQPAGLPGTGRQSGRGRRAGPAAGRQARALSRLHGTERGLWSHGLGGGEVAGLRLTRTGCSSPARCGRQRDT